jgi:transposase
VGLKCPNITGMRHVDMRKLPAAAQEERRRQVIGLRQSGMTYQEIADLVGLSPTGVLNICHRFAAEGAKKWSCPASADTPDRLNGLRGVDGRG